jgi:hypothetical protein
MRIVLTLGAALAAVLTGGAASASAAAQAGDPAPSAAVVTPMLGVFQYGAGSGLPLTCSVSSGLLTSGADQSQGGSKSIAPVISQLNDSCTLMSTSGKDFFGQAIEESRALAPINPVVNPALATIADTLARAGTGDAGTLAPFGPTVAGTGGLFGFLQGH